MDRSTKYGFYKPSTTPAEFLKLEEFRLLSLEEKELVFRHDINQSSKRKDQGISLVSRLSELAPDVCDRFELKPDPVKDLTMRLWCPEHVETSTIESYICLSYCCDASRKPKIVGDQISIPTTPLLFSAFQSQRSPNRCGLWVDQLCIAQDDVKEKSIAIGAMDTVYRCADLVVVILQDIEMHLAQQEFLRTMLEMEGNGWWLDPDGKPNLFEDEEPYFKKHPLLVRFLATILQSRYFERAWCTQELEVGSRFVFCMPCQPAEAGDDQSEVFWFDADFLTWMIMHSTKVPFSSASHKSLRGWKHLDDLRARLNRISTAGLASEYETYMTLTSQSIAYRSHIGETSGAQPLYPEVTQRIFSLSAEGDATVSTDQRLSSALLDKMSLVLNIIGNGLRAKRKPGEKLTEWGCIKELCLLGLAAGDALTLCTMGQHIKLSPDMNKLSWLQLSGLQDCGSGTGGNSWLPPMPRTFVTKTQIDPNPEHNWISLDCFAFGAPQAPQKQFRAIANQLVTRCIELKMGRRPKAFPWSETTTTSTATGDAAWAAEHLKSHIADSMSPWGSGPEYQYWYSQTLAGAWRLRFELVIACILECGMKWILTTALRCGFPAIVAVFPKLKAAFPEYTWDVASLATSSWDTSETGKAGVDAILSLAHWCVQWGYVRPYGQNSNYIPALFAHGRQGTGRAMVFYRSDAMLQTVLPVMLMEEPYSRLYRVWLLQAEDDHDYAKLNRGQTPKWFLRAKSILFTDIPCQEIEFSSGSAGDGKPGWRFRPGVIVHAPPDFVNEEIKKNLREPEESKAPQENARDLVSNLIANASFPTKDQERARVVTDGTLEFDSQKSQSAGSELPAQKAETFDTFQTKDEGMKTVDLVKSSANEPQQKLKSRESTKSGAEYDEWGWASRAWQKQKKSPKKS